jgi:hypothetical protein
VEQYVYDNVSEWSNMSMVSLSSTDNGASWEKYDNPVEVKEDQDILLITK